MTERPILFRGEMVRAILEGRKTMTRRVVKPQPPLNCAYVCKATNGWAWTDGSTADYDYYPKDREALTCPYGGPGDRLYVKEATWIWCDKRPAGATPKGRQSFRYIPVGRHVVYCADSTKPTERVDANPRHNWRFKTSRFMPRWASRIAREIAGIRMQRLQEISDEDAMAEGVFLSKFWTPELCRPYRSAFRKLWDSINGKRFPWDSNPWLWAITFRSLNGH